MKNIFNRKSVFVKSLSVWSAFAVIITTSAPAFAAGTAVLGGSADLQNLTRATMDKNDTNAAVFSSDAASAVLDWNRFNIGSGQSMSFNGAGTTFFNLVDGAAGRSQIDGIINGSGNVWVINPAGIAFGASSSVNVGGLFAAAAGNLENAAALRDGTATMPSFSSFEGSVDASKGTFTASQVALMGKTVSAEGDFSNVGNLTISATGGAMDVDEVQGGKVSVNIRDFTADGSEVTLGDLHIDGDLTVKATGSIRAGAKAAETPANKPMLLMAEKKGPVIQAGDIDIEGADLEIEGKLQSTAGHVDVLAYGSLDVNAEVNAADYASLQALGDIDVNADVIAGGGDATIYSYNGSVTVEAGKTVSALGNVDITAGMGDGVNGDVTIDGNVESSFGNVMLYSGYGDQSTGDVTINGNVTATKGNVAVSSANGDVIVLAHGSVSAAKGDVYLQAAQAAQAEGGWLEVSEDATVSGKRVFLGVGTQYGFDALIGDVNYGATGGKGDLYVGGSVTGSDRVMVGTSSGIVWIGEKGKVSTLSSGAELDVEAGVFKEGIGSVLIDGSIDSAGIAFLSTASGGDGAGDIEIGQKGLVSAKDAAYLYAGHGNLDWNTFEMLESFGYVVVKGAVAAPDVDIQAGYNCGYGEAFGYGMGGSQVQIGATANLSAANSAKIFGVDGVSGAGGVDVTGGSLEVSAGYGTIGLTGVVKAGDASFSSVGYGYCYFDVTANNAANDFTGTVTAKGNNVSLADANDVTLGSVSAAGNLTVKAGGDIVQTEQDAVKAYEIGKTTTLEAGGDIVLENAENNFYKLSAKGGTVSVNDKNYVYLGEVSAKEAFKVVAGTQIIGDGDSVVDVSGGTLDLSGKEIVIDGVAKAADATLTATGAGSGAGRVFLRNAENDFTGKVTAKGTDVELVDANALVVGDVSASSGDVIMRAGDGDLVVEHGTVSAASDVKLRANGGIFVREASAVVAQGGDAVLETVTSGDRDAARNVEIAGEVSGKKRVFIGANVLDNGAEGQSVLKKGTGEVVISGSVSAHDGLYALTADGDVSVTAGGLVSLAGDGASAYLDAAMRTGAKGNVNVAGSVSASGEGGNILLTAAEADQSQGNVSIAGTVSATGKDGGVTLQTGNGTDSKGNIVVNGSVSSDGNILAYAGFGEGADGKLTVNGEVSAAGQVSLVSSIRGENGGIIVNGTVAAGKRVNLWTGNGDVAVSAGADVSAEGKEGTVYLATGLTDGGSGDILVDGTVSAGKDAYVLAGNTEASSGDVRFGARGSVKAGDGVYAIVKDGDLTQDGATVGCIGGRADVRSLSAAMSGETINLIVKNGSIGNGGSGYFAVDGKTYASAAGDVSIAAANGGNLKGGPGVGERTTELGTFTFGDPSGTSNIRAGGNLSVYTAGKIESSGLLQAKGDLTVSAASFGDVSYLQAGGLLTINNVGRPAYPQIAYFESVNGVEPNINNLPNDMVIFIDGRLAGGNLNILNKFGANEAFMVETPELKSTQGIFGNPPFLHSDLDVANPMAVSAVDYLIQEVPRLTLSSDFPAEVDQNVEAVGLSQKDVYWFGQKGSDEKKASDEAAEKTAETDKGSEKPSDKTVALVR